MDGQDPVAEAAPAASLILMRRPAAGGAPELLFVVRGETLRFGGGAFAFPGGRVDPADVALARRYPALDPIDAAARIAAVRETWEETGIAIGFPPARRNAAFHDLVAGAPPDLGAILPFARWRPPTDIRHRFDTRFYVADAPPGAEAIADGQETSAAFWASAADADARWRSGEGRALFPTRRLIERLAAFADAAAAAADPQSGIERAIEARLEQRDDGAWLCIPRDGAYPVCEERATPDMRG